MLAVPAGIVKVQLSAIQHRQDQKLTRACHSCGQDGHDMDADFCKYCGESLELELMDPPKGLETKKEIRLLLDCRGADLENNH